MKKCLLIPDSFKGTMTSTEICGIMKDRILHHFPKCEVISVPVADGGEGTVDCFLHILGGEKVSARVKSPSFGETKAFYGMHGKTAIIEMAAVVGLPKGLKNFNPAKATTYGVGQLIRDAVRRGCTDIILGLGGSCTNDGGAGAAAALGTKFYNPAGETFVPTGDTLGRVVRIDTSQTLKFLKGRHITAICDVDNPLYGETGAAFVYAPQKGADEVMVKMLDDQLRKFSQAIENSLHLDIGMKQGAGAGGGMGGGVVAFLGAELKKGVDTILDAIRFEDIAENCDLIFTGEGKIDAQSLRGKVVVGVARRARQIGVPVAAVVGDVGDGAEAAYGCGVSCIFSTNLRAVPFEVERTRCRENLSVTMDNLIRLIRVIEKTRP